MNGINIDVRHPYYNPILDFILAEHYNRCLSSTEKDRNDLWNEVLHQYGIILVDLDTIILDEFKSSMLILELPNV